MRHVICPFAAVFLVCLGAAPASAQTPPEFVYETGDPDAPLTLLQRQALAEVRKKDRSRFIYIARYTGAVARTGVPVGKRLVKPLAEWTQGDLWSFRREYDRFAEQRDDFEKWSTLETATMIRLLSLEGGGGD